MGTLKDPARACWLALLMAAGCGAGSSGDQAADLRGVQLAPTSLSIASNPVTGASAPGRARDRASIYRYALDPGRAVRAILILIPGTSGSAADFDYLARRLIERSGGDVEVWAFERRSNWLEDTTGMTAAVEAHDERVALDYYLNGAAVAGHGFAGFLGDPEVSYLSEFGLPAVMADLKAAFDLIPADRHSTNVFIGGHSLGAAQTVDFLAWDFDGDDGTLADAGFASVAGAVMLEGTAFGGDAPVLDQHAYEGDLADMRSGAAPVIGGFPGITPAVLALLETAAMAAHPYFDDPRDASDGPDGLSIVTTQKLPADVEGLLQFLIPADPIGALLGTGPGFRDFRMTNEAFFGLVLDDQFEPVGAQQASIGFVSPAAAVARRTLLGVPIEKLLGGFLGDKPTYGLADTSLTYGWLDSDQVDGVTQTTPSEEVSHIARLAEINFRGPANFAEWYFALRPSLDSDAMGALPNLDASSWQARDYDLDGFHTARVDVPILALGGGSGLTPDAAAFEGLRRAIAPITRDGKSRDEPAGFQITIVPGANHLDVLVADDDRPGGNGFFPVLLDWLLAHADGSVAVP